jgi:hypothetical protein
MAEESVYEISQGLRGTRAELRALLGHPDQPEFAADMPDEFPRSQLMRSLLHGKLGLGVLVLLIILLALKPRRAARLLRIVPLPLLANKLLSLRWLER